MTHATYDAILIVSFGGPEGPDDVLPFLENVLRGRNVPRERMLEVAEHYHHFGGVSPINQQCRDLIDDLRSELDEHGIGLPIYWGNRNWRPMLNDTLTEMKSDGVRHALAFVTSGFSSWSSCRQYRENIEAAQSSVGEDAPAVDKLRVFYNHPDFIGAWSDSVGQALGEIPDERRAAARVLFTAHSIPDAMASTCDYVQQLSETCRLIAADADVDDRWALVYQSRSGPPHMPWLEPDVCDAIRDLRASGTRDVVVVPVGFLSDHMEVLYDLDEEARGVCDEVGMNMVRCATISRHPRFLAMIRKLITERISGTAKECVGQFAANHDVCPQDCCPFPARRPS